MTEVCNHRSALQRRVARAIVDSAARVFVEGGPGSNVNAVAEDAGVGRATLYRYFPNRDALVAEVIGPAIVQVGERLDAARLDGVTVGEGAGSPRRRFASSSSGVSRPAPFAETSPARGSRTS